MLWPSVCPPASPRIPRPATGAPGFPVRRSVVSLNEEKPVGTAPVVLSPVQVGLRLRISARYPHDSLAALTGAIEGPVEPGAPATVQLTADDQSVRDPENALQLAETAVEVADRNHLYWNQLT